MYSVENLIIKTQRQWNVVINLQINIIDKSIINLDSQIVYNTDHTDHLFRSS